MYISSDSTQINAAVVTGWEITENIVNEIVFVFVFCSMGGQQPAAPASPRDGEDVAITLGERRVISAWLISTFTFFFLQS